MKFGASLSRLSAPQWRPHDLDYDEIKKLIKIQTSSPEGCSREFEAQLLEVLDQELERIDEFVRCKAGEIDRRLAACRNIVQTYSKEAGSHGKQASLKRFLKIEGEIDRVTKDSQLLARFVNANYTGFKKLIKKHAKWCRLSPRSPLSLTSQFVPHLETQRPFHRRVNFQDIMRQLSELYNTRFEEDHIDDGDSHTSDEKPVAVGDMADDNIDPQFQSCVTYWVHNDNRVETQLFLLKNLTLQLPSLPATSEEIQRSVRTAYLDGSDWKVYERLVPETAENVVPHWKAPQIRWEENSKNRDVLVVIPEDSGYLNVPLKRKFVSVFLSSKELDINSHEWNEMTPTSDNWMNSVQAAHKYIQSSSLTPVIQVSAQRTAFSKISKNKSSDTISKVYATMDRNICSTRLPYHIDFLALDGEEELVDLQGYKNVFPHSLLTIRWEGDSPRWLEELNSSHLIERVNGFSAYVHAAACLMPSQLPKLPYWMPLLQKDIRKLQPPPQSVRKRDSTSLLVTTNSTSQEVRASSEGYTQAASPLTPSLPPSRHGKRSGNESSSQPPSPIVYWSEFETTEEEPYTVPVDENAPLLPWFRRNRRQEDLERQDRQYSTEEGRESKFGEWWSKVSRAVEMGVKSSANGLTTLFYEKHVDVSTDDEYTSEDSSAESDPLLHGSVGLHINPEVRATLLNRGYSLCVVGCLVLEILFGIVGVVLGGEAATIAIVLVGLLISMSLEIVSLTRFIMQGGHTGIAWTGLLAVVLVAAAFVPLVAWEGA